MNLATEAEKKLTKIIDVFTGVIIPPAVGQEDAILVDDSEEEVVSDLSSCELKHANTERSRTPSEPRIPPGQQPVYFGADLSAAELQDRYKREHVRIAGVFRVQSDSRKRQISRLSRLSSTSCVETARKTMGSASIPLYHGLGNIIRLHKALLI